MQDSSGRFLDSIPADAWRIVKGAVPMLHFNTTPASGGAQDIIESKRWAETTMTDGYVLRIEGWSAQARLVNDTDVCNVDPAFIVHRASQWLHSKRVRRADNEPDEHRTQSLLHKAEADSLKPRIQTALPPGTRRVEA